MTSNIGGPWARVLGEGRWFAATGLIRRIANWPFQGGRSPTTPTNVEAQTCSPIFWYYHTDHLGSSNVLTDRSGVRVKHYEYKAFGDERYEENVCSFSVSSRYTGQVLDEETGLYYYSARYYDPELGRVGQIGQEVIKQGVNRAVIEAGANLLTGAVAGGIGSVLGGGDFWAGAAYGATGAAIAVLLQRAPGELEPSLKIENPLRRQLGFERRTHYHTEPLIP